MIRPSATSSGSRSWSAMPGSACDRGTVPVTSHPSATRRMSGGPSGRRKAKRAMRCGVMPASWRSWNQVGPRWRRCCTFFSLRPDGRIRELRLDGAAITGGTRPPDTEMPAELYTRAHATTLTLRLIDTGTPVTIRPPHLDQVVLQPADDLRGPVPLYGLVDPS